MVLARRIAAAALMILIVGGLAHAAPQAPRRGAGTPPAPETQAAAALAAPVVDERNAEETRDQLNELLGKYPPALGRVLKLDPSLLANQAYLAPYPSLASFLAIHPEVAHNPTFFLARVETPDGSWRAPDARMETIGFWKDFYQDVGGFIIGLVVIFSLLWVIRTLLDWRRWTRLARVQAEVHAKLLDRLTANEELLTYIQTPAGRRFLESGPVLAESGPRPLGAPVSRILWSFQAGIVLAVGGLGLAYVSGRVVPEVGQGLSIMGILAVALGIGFMLSAVAAWLISRRMGLFDSLMTPPQSRDINAA